MQISPENMEIRLLSKSEQKIELSITLFESICKKNNWNYNLGNSITYSNNSPNGECIFSISTTSLIEKSILVGTIRNKKYPNDILFDIDFSFCNLTFELIYQDDVDVLSDIGILFVYSFVKAFLTEEQNWVVEDLDNWRTYNIENIDEFAITYKIPPNSLVVAHR